MRNRPRAENGGEPQLGSHDGNGQPPPSDVVRTEELLSVVKALLPHENRLQACLRATVKPNNPRSDLPEGVTRFDVDPETGKARFIGYCSCDNVWLCPRCAPKMEEEKKRLLKDDLFVWEKAGYTTGFVVLTLQHFHREALKTVAGRVEKALSTMLNSKPGTRFKRKWQIYGRLRSPDYTFGENGHHPHVNILVFLERRALSALEQQEFEAELSTLWADYVEKIGGYADLEHGCFVTWDKIYEKADYIASKVLNAAYTGTETRPGSWGAPEELTKTRHKTARRKSFTAAGLLRYHAGWDDLKFNAGDDIPDWLLDFTPEKAGKVFCEYASVYKGKHFIDSSAGLRSKLCELKEAFTEELAAQSWNVTEEKPNYQPVVYLSSAATYELSRLMMVYWLKEEISKAKDNPEQVKGFLEDSGITETYFPALDPEKPDWLAYPGWSKEDIDSLAALSDIMREYNQEFSNSPPIDRQAQPKGLQLAF